MLFGNNLGGQDIDELILSNVGGGAVSVAAGGAAASGDAAGDKGIFSIFISLFYIYS